MERGVMGAGVSCSDNFLSRWLGCRRKSPDCKASGNQRERQIGGGVHMLTGSPFLIHCLGKKLKQLPTWRIKNIIAPNIKGDISAWRKMGCLLFTPTDRRLWDWKQKCLNTSQSSGSSKHMEQGQVRCHIITSTTKKGWSPLFIYFFVFHRRLGFFLSSCLVELEDTQTFSPSSMQSLMKYIFICMLVQRCYRNWLSSSWIQFIFSHSLKLPTMFQTVQCGSVLCTNYCRFCYSFCYQRHRLPCNIPKYQVWSKNSRTILFYYCYYLFKTKFIFFS